MSPGARKGPIAQRELAATLVALIDAAMAANSTAHKDIARSKLRAILGDPAMNIRTPFIGHNLGAKRSRWLNSFGFWVPMKWVEGGWTGPKAEAPEGEE